MVNRMSNNIIVPNNVVRAASLCDNWLTLQGSESSSILNRTRLVRLLGVFPGLRLTILEARTSMDLQSLSISSTKILLHAIKALAT